MRAHGLVRCELRRQMHRGAFNVMLGRTCVRSIWSVVVTAGLLLAILGTHAQAQTVLRTARGLASDDVLVLVNRAIVVESVQPFVEVSVAQPEIADVSPLSDRAIYIFGRARGATTLTLLGENGQLIANVDIVVGIDTSELKQRLAEVMPDEPIEVRTAGGSVILSGVVSGAAKIDTAMRLANAYVGGAATNMMSVGGTQQVALKVRVAQITREFGKELGVSLSGANLGNNTFGLGGQSGGVARDLSDPDNVAQAITEVITPTALFGGLGAIFNITDTAFIDLQLSLNEARSFARTLAEPTLIARSGAEASFLAGGEVAIPVVSEDGADVTFRPTGVALDFLPVVLDEDLMSISLEIEVTLPSTTLPPATSGDGGISFTIPSFDTNRASTTVNLRDGESFMIAGLVQEGFDDSISQFPWLGDLPVVGPFFRNTAFGSAETELVILVTANLVVPAESPDLLTTPLDTFAIPSERQLFLDGRLSVPGSGALPSQAFDGPHGYIVE
ncbi:MAG: type II and III secretion system protein family protein [Pseudomonadota bacterium]